MVYLEFINNFVAEIALDISFVAWVISLLTPTKKKYKILSFVLMIILIPFYAFRVLSFSNILSISFFILFSIPAILILSHIIKDRALFLASEEYKRKTKIKHYGFDKSFQTTENFIGLFWALSLSAITLLFGSFFGIFQIPIALFIIILSSFVMGNYYLKKNTTNKYKKSKIAFFTLFLVTTLSSLSLFLVSFSYLFGLLKETYLVAVSIAILPVLPFMIVGEKILKEIRYPFVSDKKISNYFIKNYKRLIYSSLIITILLSDLPIIIAIFQRQDINLMIFWMIGFVSFVTQMAITLIRDLFIFKEEAKMRIS